MRKKIITLLYSHKVFAWMLPMFHLIIGHSRIYMGRNNVCDTSTTNIYRSSIKIQKGMRQTGNCLKPVNYPIFICLRSPFMAMIISSKLKII